MDSPPALPFTVEEARACADECHAGPLTHDQRLTATLREYARLREAVSEIEQALPRTMVHQRAYAALDKIRAIVERLNTTEVV